MNWYQNALTEIKSHLSTEDLPDAERQARCLAAIDGLHHLFHELLGELKIRDNGPIYFVTLHHFQRAQLSAH